MAYNNRGVEHYKLGQYQCAIEDYNKAIRMKPYDSGNYNNRGAAYTMLGQYQRAINDFNKAIGLKSNYADAYARGGIYLLRGNKELGCPDAQKLCALGNCKLLKWAKGKGYCR